ncbi:MAG: Gfo/Idh/MocA family oxidoreductase [Pseudomonadales bacterium]|nr:Gfo/Idh/MocA family oxidoreductase [Pseudomonadales bacterium]
MELVRWGIVGTGRMATTMAAEITAMGSSSCTLTAVASRRLSSARTFADRYGAANAWGSVTELANDPTVDAVYIATPHSEHSAHMLVCIAANKAVLCEKPFTLNADEAERVAAAARTSGTFVMEAMWTRFLPAVVALRELLASHAIGRVQVISGGGAFVPEFVPEHYLFNRELGGGVLLDAGVYLVSMASMILGTPTRILASGSVGQRGVDEQNAIVLEYADGANALLYVSLRTRRAPDLEILGDAGRIRIAAPIFKPAQLTVWTRDAVARTDEYPISGSGYGYQIREVCDALRAGRSESSVMPLNETLSIMHTLDSIRGQIGVRYPSEQVRH